MNPEVRDVEQWSGLKAWAYSLFNRNPKSNLVAIERLSLGSGDRFLDLGCGPGAAVEHAMSTGAEAAGIDPSPPMVERASKRAPGADVRVGSAEDIPFPDDRFTAALAVSTYHHWADPAAGLAEVGRVLAPDGRLLIVERKLKRREGHGLDVAGADRLASNLVGQGFAEVEVGTFRGGRAVFFAASATVRDGI